MVYFPPPLFLSPFFSSIYMLLLWLQGDWLFCDPNFLSFWADKCPAIASHCIPSNYPVVSVPKLISLLIFELNSANPKLYALCDPNYKSDFQSILKIY